MLTKIENGSPKVDILIQNNLIFKTKKSKRKKKI